MSVLVNVPLDGGGFVLVEADRADLPSDQGLTLATPEPGKALATASKTLSESLERIVPVVNTVKDKLEAAAPDHYAVEFGIKLGGETGIILGPRCRSAHHMPPSIAIVVAMLRPAV